jgi:hypothetical protein
LRLLLSFLLAATLLIGPAFSASHSKPKVKHPAKTAAAKSKPSSRTKTKRHKPKKAPVRRASSKSKSQNR